jgi:hypothetical protein
VEAPAAQAAAIGGRLGGKVNSLSNVHLLVDGRKLQVNTIQAGTADDAARIRKSLLGIKPSPNLVLIREKEVIEFVVEDVRLAVRAHYVLGYRPKSVTYRVEFQAAPIKSCDYMKWNRLFNACLAFDRNPPATRGDAESAIGELATAFEFGNELWLKPAGQGKIESRFTFTPAAGPAGEGSGLKRVTFDSLPRKAGLPYVNIEAEVYSEAFAFTPSPAPDLATLTTATDFFPSTQPEIVALSREITRQARTDRDKVLAILEWLRPGQNVKYAGNVTGSRYGTAAVLKQGFGHCWDFSDCFVTLCRAANVPARQVGGWLYEQSGHVWAEVYYPEGWQAYDPTLGMECGSDYVAYLASEDGRWPLAYVSEVAVEPVKP